MTAVFHGSIENIHAGLRMAAATDPAARRTIATVNPIAWRVAVLQTFAEAASGWIRTVFRR